MVSETKIITVCPKCHEEIEIDISQYMSFIVKLLKRKDGER